MIFALLLVPALSVISAIILYRHNGKKELMRFDLVQFFYAFVLSPIFFIWTKTFIFILLRQELDIRLNAGQILAIDTAISTLLLYVYGFVVIHSLTTSFKLKKLDDPLHNLFEHSEYFHLWLTHIVMYLGLMLVFFAFSVINVFFPLALEMSKLVFYLVYISGFLIGFITFLVILLSDPKQKHFSFIRLMKVLFGVFFLAHVIVYFLYNPDFSAQYGVYWWNSAAFTSLVICSYFSYRYKRARGWFDRLTSKFKYKRWGKNIQLFDKLKQ